MNRIYYVDVSRCNPDDRLTPRNINVSFSNNSNIEITALIFVYYLDEFSIDVVTGLVKKNN